MGRLWHAKLANIFIGLGLCIPGCSKDDDGDRNDGGGINEYLTYFALPGAGIATSGTSGSERYYDFVQGSVHFFMLDSDDARASQTSMAAQQAWLQQQLAASTSPFRVVVMHHAPYSSANHGSYPELQWPYAVWGADAVIAAL